MTYSDSKYKLSWAVTNVKRGNEALNIVKSGSKYNSYPDPGYEYLLCKYLITNRGSNDFYATELLTLVPYAGGTEATHKIATLPSAYHELPRATLKNGGSISGWVLYQVPTDSNVKVYLDDPKLANKGKYYVQL